MATTRFGLHSTALVYSASLAALIAVTAGILLSGPAGRQPGNDRHVLRLALDPGSHLVARRQPYARITVRPRRLQVLVPAHCTGWRAQHAMGRRFGEAFAPNTVGTRFTL